MEASEVAGFFTSLGAAFCSRTAANDSFALPHLWQSTLPIPSLCLQNINVAHLPYRAGAEPSPYLSNAEGLRASTRQYCAHGVVNGELLLQPTACFEDLVVQASWASPYGWYLRQVLSALLDRSREFGLRLLRV